MIAKELVLKNFRNYSEQKIVFGDGVNVFYGKNAQGKTNILEAVSLFSGTRSHRGGKDSELINFDADDSALELSFCSMERDFCSEIFLSRGKKKKIRINGVNKRSISSLAEVFSVVMFTPEDLSVIKGSPSERRRLLDSAISSVKPAYLNALVTYNKVLDNKNKLLKAENPDCEMIKLWNEALCETGSRIISYRSSFTEVLRPVIGKFHEKISGGEELFISYKTVCEEKLCEKDIKELLLKKTSEGIEKEIAAGVSLYGPHRDDMEFFINGRDVKTFGSQGQQRTVVLGFKLSQIEIAKQIIGEYPVLLLDDILSELDSVRRSYLLNKISEHQVLITCTEADELKTFGNVRLFEVTNGNISNTL